MSDAPLAADLPPAQDNLVTTARSRANDPGAHNLPADTTTSDISGPTEPRLTAFPQRSTRRFRGIIVIITTLFLGGWLLIIAHQSSSTIIPTVAGSTTGSRSLTPIGLSEGPAYAVPALLASYHIIVTDLMSGDIADLGHATLRVNGAPHGLAFATKTHQLWVSNVGGTNSWVFTATSAESSADFQGNAQSGPGPVHFAFSPDGQFAYVTDFAGSAVTVVNTTALQVQNTIPTPRGPHAIAISADGRMLFVACPIDGAFAFVDTASARVVAQVAFPAGAVPYGDVLSPDGRTVYVSDETFGRVYAIDVATHTVTDSVQIGARPALMAWIPGTTRFLVANNGSGTVSVVETRPFHVVATIATGGGPHGVAVTPDSRYALVANTQTDTVTAIDLHTLTVVAQIPVGRFPNDVAVLPRA